MMLLELVERNFSDEKLVKSINYWFATNRGIPILNNFGCLIVMKNFHYDCYMTSLRKSRCGEGGGLFI